MAPKLITEAVGTFFLVLTIGLTGVVGPGLGPFAVAAVLTGMIYMGGHVSAAHYNPAVTLAFWLRRAMPAREVGPYVAVQLAGAVAGAAVALAISGDVLQVRPAPETSAGVFFLIEAVFTFALVLVIMNVGTASGTAGNGFYGAAIGLVVLGGALVAGPVSGGAFNPAVALGPAAVDAVVGDGASLAGLWVYLAATPVGAALAVAAFRGMNPGETP